MKAVPQRLVLTLAASLLLALVGCDSNKELNGPPVAQPQAPDPASPATKGAKAPHQVVLKAPN